jgi:MotA/TolQ/ExbB proton channel family
MGEMLPLTLQDLVRESFEHRLLALIIFFLCALAIDFLLRFCIPAVRLLWSLKRISRSLPVQGMRSAHRGGDLAAMVGEAEEEPAFAGPWREYSKTLHGQRGVDEHGQRRIIRWRATALAETFFTEQALVNSPLHTEYFKHLPGILTGLGIIGTFRGLIQGLRNFLPSLDPRQMQDALTALIKVVGDAFLTSAVAIILAISFTLIEKLLLNMCYRKVEAIQRAIDRLFDAGVGEEYLERLVKASETSATQAIQIKDALVADLKQILTEVTTRQLEASARDSKEISTHVAEVIVKRLGGPIETISEAVKYVGSSQGEAIHSMLADVLVRFSDQIQATFGGHMNGISETLTQTTNAMEQTAIRIEQLASSLDAAGKNTTNAMAERWSDALSSTEARQQLMNRQTAEFVEQIRMQVSQSQKDNAEKLQQTLAKLAEQVVAVVGQLHEQSRASMERQREEGRRFVDQTGETVSGLSREVENLIRQSSETSRSLLGSIDSLAEATRDSISRMNKGAELLYVASSDFAKAGEIVTASMNGAGGAIERIQAATYSLSSAMNGTIGILDEYKQSRDAFATMVADLRATIQNARKEAFMTSDLVEKLEAAAAQLASAEKQSELYLAGVNDVLTRTHEAFAANLERTLNHGNARFHVELAKAVDLLSDGIRGLENAIEMVPARS